MRKILLIALLFICGCSDMSRVFTPEVDKELNYQNIRAFEKIEKESIVPDIKRVAVTGKKNATQLCIGSVGFPENKAEDFSHEKSADLREKSQEEADKSIGADWLKIAETSFPWTALVITGIGIYTGYRKRKRLEALAEMECLRKEAVYAGVDKIKKNLPNQEEKINSDMKEMAGKFNLFLDIKKDYKDWKNKK